MKPQKRSERCEIINLGVSFNLLDPYQKKLYDYAKSLCNFSAAAKRWLDQEMSGEMPSIQNAAFLIENDEDTAFDPLESLL